MKIKTFFLRNHRAVLTIFCMSAMPIYGKTLQLLLLWNRWADFHESWCVALGTPAHYTVYVVYSNDDPGVNLTYFTARLNLVNLAFL